LLPDHLGPRPSNRLKPAREHRIKATPTAATESEKIAARKQPCAIATGDKQTTLRARDSTEPVIAAVAPRSWHGKVRDLDQLQWLCRAHGQQLLHQKIGQLGRLER